MLQNTSICFVLLRVSLKGTLETSKSFLYLKEKPAHIVLFFRAHAGKLELHEQKNNFYDKACRIKNEDINGFILATPNIH